MHLIWVTGQILRSFKADLAAAAAAIADAAIGSCQIWAVLLDGCEDYFNHLDGNAKEEPVREK